MVACALALVCLVRPFPPGTHVLDSPLRITSPCTLDLAGVILTSGQVGLQPDSYADTAIVIEANHVTLLNATVRGFKVGILARACTSAVIQGCDVSFNFRQRLFSTPQRENYADWLTPHFNDEDEWATRYGAGIYLDRCLRAVVAGNTGCDGQNGIVLSRTDSSLVCDNTMSYNSGWGLAMWRSCANEVSHNRFDYCVRGYSHGVYHRGQDSAGILVFEQCSHNVFAFNSATHGGDGFFLYAGHETLERTGLGGSNHNLLYGNDFSHAVANGIEATFSQGNRFVANVIHDCDFGIWAGYSSQTQILANTITGCSRAGIAIEHGRDNVIQGNTLRGNGVGILLWAFPGAPFDTMAFGRTNPTHSGEYTIGHNTFQATPVAIRLHATRNATVFSNVFRADTVLSLRTEAPGLCFSANTVEGAQVVVHNQGPPVVVGPWAGQCSTWVGEVAIQDPPCTPPDPVPLPPPPPTRGTGHPFIPPTSPRGRHTIQVTDWGPLRAPPAVFPLEVFGGTEAEVFVRGHGEPFQVRGVTGHLEAYPRSGVSPASLTISTPRTTCTQGTLDVQVGDETFRCTVFLVPARWQVVFHALPARELPHDLSSLAGVPLDSLSCDEVDFWWADHQPTPQVPGEYFATVAQATVGLPPGSYTAHAIADDGVRVWVDGALVLDDWSHHGPRHTSGRFHTRGDAVPVRIEHCQLDGLSWLQFWISP